MKFSVDLDIASAIKLTNAIAKQIPFAMAKALTQTAIQAQTDIVQAIAQVFDRPTPYTLNWTHVIPATKDRLESFVQLKDSAAKGTPAIKFLDPEVFDGERNPKRGEKALQRMGALASGSFIMPGAGLKLDQYGNISAGTMTKILSAVQANPDYYQNVTQKSPGGPSLPSRGCPVQAGFAWAGGFGGLCNDCFSHVLTLRLYRTNVKIPTQPKEGWMGHPHVSPRLRMLAWATRPYGVISKTRPTSLGPPLEAVV